MTDDEVAAQIARTDAFIAAFRELIADTAVDPASPCADAHRHGLERIAATVNRVDYVFFSNLANIDTAMRGGLLDLIEVHLMCVGAGPTLDYPNATAFLAPFETMIEAARKRRLQ